MISRSWLRVLTLVSFAVGLAACPPPGDDSGLDDTGPGPSEVLDGDWWNRGMPDLIAALDQHIAAAADADPNDMSEDLDLYLSEQDELLDFLELRRDYLQENLGCNAD